MKKSERGFTLPELIIVVAIFFSVVLVPAVTVYLGGSLITSAVKSSSQQCDQTLGAEKVFNGDWFCPDK